MPERCRAVLQGILSRLSATCEPGMSILQLYHTALRRQHRPSPCLQSWTIQAAPAKAQDGGSALDLWPAGRA